MKSKTFSTAEYQVRNLDLHPGEAGQREDGNRVLRVGASTFLVFEPQGMCTTYSGVNISDHPLRRLPVGTEFTIITD